MIYLNWCLYLGCYNHNVSVEWLKYDYNNEEEDIKSEYINEKDKISE